MESNYTVYIDESGDLGYCRGTRWFVLSGVIVRKTDEKEIRRIIKSIRNRFNYNEIHLKKIDDYRRRLFIARELSKADFRYINILADTKVFSCRRLNGTGNAYNYLCRLLLERVSLALKTVDGCADIMLSARGTSRDAELVSYIKDKLLPYENNVIDEARFGSICAMSSNQWDLLQLADVCATSTFLAYEETEFGFCLPCLALSLAHNLFVYDGKIDGYGLKFVKPTVSPNAKEQQKKRPCTTK